MRREPAPPQGPGLPIPKDGPATGPSFAAPAGADDPDVSLLASVAQGRRMDRLRRSVVLQLYAVAFVFSCTVTVVLSVFELHRHSRSGIELARTAVWLFASRGAGIFAAAFFVAGMADRLVMRHLRAIAQAVSRNDYREAPRALMLDRPRRGTLDELDRVVLAFNAMGTRLYCAHLVRDDFEARVVRLTSELARANLDLSDVSERKEAEEKLRASQASLANAQRLAGIGDWRWDAEKGVTHWSEEIGVIVGLLPQDDSRCTYARYLQSVHPGDRAAVRRALRRVIARRHAQAVDHRIVGATGEERIVQLKVEAEAPGGKSGSRGGLVGTIQDVTERKRIEQELLESREKLREFGAYMEATREDERKRIALEIHDELGQLLTALKMDVSLLKMRLTAPDLLAKVAEMRELVDKTIWMVRNVANHLRPAALNFGLASALEWLAEDFARRNNIPCQFRMNDCEPVLAEAHATAVFRIVQESLTNAARHARATRVHVTLTRSERGFELHVSDNGYGFDPVAATNGYSYGLLSMSERARLIGASLRIDSAPGTGTVVSVSVPLNSGRPA
jgi:signal transduction histidine kinase